MRILLIIPDLRRGGAEKIAVTLAHGLVSRGHDVKLLLFYRQVEFQISADIAVDALTRPGRRMRFGWLDKRILARALRRWSRTTGPFDLVVTSLSFASEVAHLAGIETWHHIHSTLSAELDALAPDRKIKAHRRLRRYRRIFEGRNLIAVSEGVAHDLRTRIGLSESRIVTIHNLHDFAGITALAAADSAILPPRPYVLHAGRFAEGKRHDVLLDAFAASGIPHNLILLTNPSADLDRMIEARGLSSRVSVIEFQDNPYPWYAGASALILSSDHEGLPNVLIEALACGTPVVSTDCPSGPREILQGALARYLSPVGDVGALARNLRSVVEAPPRIDPKTLDKFSLGPALDKFEALAVGRSGRGDGRNNRLWPGAPATGSTN